MRTRLSKSSIAVWQRRSMSVPGQVRYMGGVLNLKGPSLGLFAGLVEDCSFLPGLGSSAARPPSSRKIPSRAGSMGGLHREQGLGSRLQDLGNVGLKARLLRR